MTTTRDTEPQLARGLESRHIQMMALGGAIGTGLFLGAGQSIHLAGPSLLLAYALAGGVFFFLMRALGELLVSDDGRHSFIDYIRRYLGEDWGSITGWTYWICWVSVGMSEITAVGMYMKFWFPNLPQWLTCLVVLVLLLTLNLISVGLYGEAEFWFALIKVVAIIALIVVGLYMILTHFPTSSGHATFANLWVNGGVFPNGVEGFLKSFQMVTFSFACIEMVGLTASEAKNPDVVIPKAINELPTRIMLFYVGALAVIMSIFPWSTLSASSSPFVQVFANAGIRAAADIVNFVVLTAAASSCNSGLFSTGRLLFSMALISKNPRVKGLAKLSKRQVPARAIVASTAVIGIAVILNVFLPDTVFALLSSVVTVSFLFVWAMIMLAHLQYKKRHPEADKFKAPLFPVSDYLVLVFLAVVAVVMMFDPAMRIAELIALVWLVALYSGHKWHKQPVSA